MGEDPLSASVSLCLFPLTFIAVTREGTKKPHIPDSEDTDEWAGEQRCRGLQAGAHVAQ